jgi:hypothetical protein
MYGAKTTIAASSSGLAGVAATSSTHIWLLFAAITVLFALSAVAQLARKPKAHRP